VANEKRDYYELLGIAKGATAEEVKTAYRRQAIKFHPDKNPGDKNAEATFKLINEAYEVLSDSQKRAAYDRFGHAGVNGGTTGAPGGAGGWGGGFEGGDIDLGDIFGSIFGSESFSGGAGTRKRGESFRGQDIAVEAEVTLHEAFEGTKKPVRIQRAEKCETCNGSGAKPGTQPATCKTCGGAGQIRSQRGFFVMSQTCPTCRGDGRVIQSPCATCRGAGAVEKATTVTVRIPPGVRDGTSLRIQGAGHSGLRGGTAGDLFIVIHIAKDSRYTREGDDLYVEEHITFPQAAMGAEISVATLEDAVTMKIPPGTQSGALFRLRDRGMPKLGARGRGEQFVRVTVDIPKSLTTEQRDQLRQYARSMGENPAKYEESVLRKIFGR
jgi:molecular chaperone DnaJ